MSDFQLVQSLAISETLVHERVAASYTPPQEQTLMHAFSTPHSGNLCVTYCYGASHLRRALLSLRVTEPLYRIIRNTQRQADLIRHATPR